MKEIFKKINTKEGRKWYNKKIEDHYKKLMKDRKKELT